MLKGAVLGKHRGTSLGGPAEHLNLTGQWETDGRHEQDH